MDNLTSLYGNHLPIFPYLGYAPITQERVERVVEHLMDRADKAFLSTDTTQAQYDAWCKALNEWARRMERQAR